MDLCSVDDHFLMNRWLPVLAHGEDISILFHPKEHISHRARYCEVNTQSLPFLHFRIFFDLDVEMLVLGLETSYNVSTLA
jgi:hypothetical protein